MARVILMNYEICLMDYEAILASIERRRPVSVRFLVLPGTSLMNFASAIDPLRAGNRIAGRTLFDWRALSLDATQPRSSAGLPLPTTGRFDATERCDILGIMAGFGAGGQQGRALPRAVWRAARGAALTLGIESGGWPMAQAGLLDGRRATTHWEDLEDFAAAFPQVDVRPERFVVDGHCVTTSGASPTFDLMIDLLRLRAGRGIALSAAGIFNYDIAHRPEDHQSPVAFGPSARFDPRLIRAVDAMQASLDAPITTASIARNCGLSARGLEVLFRRELGQSPARYYMSLRLIAARKLVLDTGLPILDIAIRTGFGSNAAFSRAYRQHYSTSPTVERRAVRAR
ncbi:GlxA family transcriptional regulator [Paracoccus sp. TK19116]|uniref:GlxA family transcriptional regulator n=1 Tax=Paracoccus albicereus TaxID=2922394 RepID=A0ABT1MTG0_9RHOB|nr:GlxA family transcriptional regulator [Paracoccus albicereus]MCQ0971424.1 GlxA family transcriptional regulator [Paracoccus albicereus]